MNIDLKENWMVLQDVHGTGEELGLYKTDFDLTKVGAQLSEWEPLEELKHLQLVYAKQPYFGRALRYFNEAPWWYKKEFDVPINASNHCVLHFTNVDYYCKVWLNEVYLGEHEGYSMPFSFDVGEALRKGEKNTIIVKVWSPWDDAVEGDRQDRRTFLIKRNMVKGTYEHSDTFVARDVNPVGIYGEVSLEIIPDACFKEKLDIQYELDIEKKIALLSVETEIINAFEQDIYIMHLICKDKLTRETVCDIQKEFSGNQKINISGHTDEIYLWNTWDHGMPYMYTTIVKLEKNGECIYQYEETIGFRNINMIRDENQTTFLLNGKKFYVRGTSYFPDVYISAMTVDRYKRDLLAIKASGFNLIRIHVHVEQKVFYSLCDELGIAIMHDSEYNWTHPFDTEFSNRFISIYSQTVQMLMEHPSIFCWICMNEPGALEGPEQKSESKAMTVNPGPALYEAVTQLDKTRPVIKGSYCNDDLFSGDSHNYIGSLSGENVHYSEIYGTTEKLNTEYGFDAPGNIENLKKVPEVYERLKNIENDIEKIQEYQYALIKYYTEHYRMQKYTPCSGYVHFLFNDLCPQSFYGLYDWWGVPKKGLDAILESNMPLGIFIKYKDNIDGIYVVNDSYTAIGECQVKWVFTDEHDNIIEKLEKTIILGSDCLVKVTEFTKDFSVYSKVNAALIIEKEGVILATNKYYDMLHMPIHTPRHPSRMNHELGMRVYYA